MSVCAEVVDDEPTRPNELTVAVDCAADTTDAPITSTCGQNALALDVAGAPTRTDCAVTVTPCAAVVTDAPVTTGLGQN